MSSAGTLTVAGRPTGARGWRDRVATATRGGLADAGADGLAMSFALPSGRWVDVDTLAEATLRGLRDAGVYARGFPALDAFVATKEFAEPHGVTVRPVGAALVRSCAPPGACLLEVAHPVALGGGVGGKRAWRAAVDRAWCRPPLDGAVWADVGLATTGSLLGPLEAVLDALEPCLGRDPRGRARQEFFPRDDLITWLRVVRLDRGGAAVRLRLGAAT